MLRNVHVFVSPHRTRFGFPYAELIEGIQESTGCPNMCFNLLPPTEQVGYVRALIERDRADGTPSGCILVGCLREIQETVLASGVPAVVFGGLYPSTSRLPSLGSDQFKVGYLLAEYLLKRGRLRLALITRETWLASDNLHHDGICRAIHEAEADCWGITIRSVPTTAIDLVSTTIAGLLEQEDRPTGLICRGPMFAAAALRVAAEVGLRVPEDLDIIFDHWGRQSHVDLPYVCPVLAYDAMARMVGKMLTELTAGEQSEQEHVTIGVQLVEKTAGGRND
jgi:LacI family transcriptional regulator